MSTYETPEELVRLSISTFLNSTAGDRHALELRWGDVWDQDEMARNFYLLGFSAPYVTVMRKADGSIGTLMYQHDPRFYFDFRPEDSPANAPLPGERAKRSPSPTHRPNRKDRVWACNLTYALKDGEKWTLPGTGVVFQFHHRLKLVTCGNCAPSDEPQFNKAKAVFEAIGWAVAVDASESDDSGRARG